MRASAKLVYFLIYLLYMRVARVYISSFRQNINMFSFLKSTYFAIDCYYLLLLVRDTCLRSTTISSVCMFRRSSMEISNSNAGKKQVNEIHIFVRDGIPATDNELSRCNHSSFVLHFVRFRD